jgi:excisionase family DNA binding protein
MTALLTQREAAMRLRLSVRTLERLRVSGGGPVFVKIGRRVLFAEEDCDAWVESHKRANTSAAEIPLLKAV